jgi:D-alanyl-D-alanine carboxypeptidase/Putative peptidoglycan binding domain
MAIRGSSNWAIDNYGKPCIGGDIVPCQWYPGLTKNQINVHRGTEPIWKALGAILLAYNYKLPTSYVGAYACRNITGGSSISRHSWPLAMDINAATNPYKRTPSMRKIMWGVDTDMPAAMVAEIMLITAGKANIRAFDWGGFWRSIKDAMHYQVRVTQAEIIQNVYAPRGFYEGGGIAPTPPQGDDEMSLSKGDKGNAVGKHQEGLIAWNPDALPKFGADKDFGGETETWVKNYQKAADLDQTGVIDGVTSALIISYTNDGGGVGKHTHSATVSEGTKVTIGETG